MTVWAQSMSDEQVVRFVNQEKSKGATQQQIVSKLLKKGVTTDQLRRIRKKYNAEQNTLGASDLTGTSTGKTSNRLR
ncbi:MAG: hypothetical protein K2H04_08720, partial [Bacteroidaceae bacterium]|nr:hypothetical protein [Bacteroidaceae bacterium]